MTHTMKTSAAAIATAALVIFSSGAQANQSAKQTQLFLMSLMTASVWEVEGTATFEEIDAQFEKINNSADLSSDEDDDDC